MPATAFEYETDHIAFDEAATRIQTSVVPMHEFATLQVRLLSSGDCLLGAAEHKWDDHLLFRAAWNELVIDGSEGEGFKSSALHVEEGRRLSGVRLDDG